MTQHNHDVRLAHPPVPQQALGIDELAPAVQGFWQDTLSWIRRAPQQAPQLLGWYHQLWQRFVALYQQLCRLPRPTRRRLQRQLGGSLAGAALLLALGQVPASQAAGSVTVTTTADTLSATCATITMANVGSLGGDGLISLREAICAANNTAGDDTINLPAGTITLALNPTIGSEDTNAEDDLDILSNGKVTIVGNAGGSIIDGGGIDRVFDVAGNVTFDLSDVTVQNGSASNYGGGILCDNSNSTITISNSTISGNQSGAYGGGIAMFGADGTITISNSTISGNQTSQYGGGIVAGGNAAAIVTSSTITNNTANASGGGIMASDATLTLSNSLIAGNTSDGGANEVLYADGGYVDASNLFGHSAETQVDAVAGFAPGASDIIATSDNTSAASHVPTALADILDATLADNDGPTQTHALLHGSPAIDAAATGPATDQRGLARPQGAGFDIGAFELIAHAPVAANNAYTTTVNTALSVAAPGILGNDSDADGDTLTASVVSGPSHGSLTLGADGAFSYTPTAGFTGSDTFTYVANDGSLDSNTATVTITVKPYAVFLPVVLK